MAFIRIVRSTPLPVTQTWRLLTDWERHGAHVPLTRTVVGTAPPTRVGTLFTARTGVGRFAFDDPMEVVAWQPPGAGGGGYVRLEKRGRVVTGWAEIEVLPAPDGASGSRVVWREALRVRGLPRPLDPPLTTAATALFTHALTALLHEP
ncbi:SRPBCC family protein [Streptomyces sp. 12297]|uniref:SRPBCC family protein n=1 Tax=Streptomyces sp. NBC_00239 TaxID=2903640 RepID=UPI002E27E311|nr:SRPBCC family protein [Streptomyces sp. NBC_00239]